VVNTPKSHSKTLFEKIFDQHVITTRESGDALLFIDRQLIHDLHYRSFEELQAAGHTIRYPNQLYATPDHSVPTTAKKLTDIPQGEMRDAVAGLQRAAERIGFTHFDMTDPRHGIVHVIGPEQGITLPGLTLVCGDSHTSTHGALGCLSFGIGSTEIKHVLATQTLWQRRPRNMRITVDGTLSPGVAAKDIILAIIRHIGASGGTGYAIEYTGSAIQHLTIEGRMTISNMTIEAGARFGIIAPDDKTLAYVYGRPHAPTDEKWEEAVAYWRTLHSDETAVFDKEINIDAAAIEPTVTWGNSPQFCVGISDMIPDPSSETDPATRANMESALTYMDLLPGTPVNKIDIDRVFIGSCTNSRIEDLRQAADVFKGKSVAVPTLVVPGSGLVKREAEREGLDRIFTDAGAEWREPGCSMCVAINSDVISPGQRCASTSNRNFQGRQGKGSRTHLVSPAMAAAAAVTGHFTDCRQLGK